MSYNIGKSGFLYMRGRVALYSILNALGIGKGDEVIIQAFTCLAVPTPIILLGAKPVYVDVSSSGYTIDIASLERSITDRTRAIVIQHTFGIPADMDRIMEIAGARGIPVVEDCCHAIGSIYAEKEVGSFGTAAFYSTEWAKPFNTGIGGILVLNDKEYKEDIEGQYAEMVSPPFKDVAILRLQYFLHETLLRPSFYWKIRDMYRFFSKKGMIIGTFSREELERKKPDYFTHKMSSWQRKLLEREVAQVTEYISRKKALKRKYDDFFSGIDMPILSVSDKCDPVLLRYPLMVEDKEGLLAKAKEERIEVGNWFVSPVHPIEGEELKGVEYERGNCPEAERKANSCMNLPMHSKITEKELKRIFGFISKNRSSILPND